MGVLSSVSVRDAAAGEIVGRHFHLHLVARQDADVVLPHLSGDRGEHGVPALDLHPEHRARERLDDLAFYLDLLFLDRHISVVGTRTAKPRAAAYPSKRAPASVRILGSPS